MARYEQTHTKHGIPILRRKQRSRGEDWFCKCCGKLLGVIHGYDVHIRIERRHEYVATLPASATCKGCGTLNRARATRSA